MQDCRWAAGLRLGLIGTGANLNGGSTSPCRRAQEFGRILVLLLFVGLATNAWPQQNPVPPASPAALPDAPQVPASPAAQQPGPLSPGSIHGVVSSPDGTVYVGVRVTLTETGSAPPSKTANTDDNGRFDFAGVPPGAFKLTVAADGFATQVQAGFLHPGESYDAPQIVLPLMSTTTDVQVTASRQDIEVEQFHEEEEQRVFGVLPNFYVAYEPDAPALSTRQKFNLAWKSSVDPISFLTAGAFAGVEQADNTYSGYGQGAQGYAKRYAANYADGFIGGMIGNAILPTLLKQDPRYFYKGTGTTWSRVLYAVASSVICKSDSGHWQPDYSGILGGLAAGGISNLYYPASNRNGVTLTFENTLIGTAGSAVQNIFQEFVVRKLTPRIPNYGPSKP